MPTSPRKGLSARLRREAGFQLCSSSRLVSPRKTIPRARPKKSCLSQPVLQGGKPSPPPFPFLFPSPPHPEPCRQPPVAPLLRPAVTPPGHLATAPPRHPAAPCPSLRRPSAPPPRRPSVPPQVSPVRIEVQRQQLRSSSSTSRTSTRLRPQPPSTSSSSKPAHLPRSTPVQIYTSTPLPQLRSGGQHRHQQVLFPNSRTRLHLLSSKVILSLFFVCTFFFHFMK